jgi:ABC-2 type transport system ATP-binding protein
VGAYRRPRRGRTTILLTTQYLDEADRLAHDVAVLDRGRLIATGTPDQLKSRLGGDALHIRLADRDDLAVGADVLSGFGDVIAVDHKDATVEVRAPDGAQLLPRALHQLDEHGLVATAAEVRRPGLDDVFLALTGRRAASPDGNGDGRSVTTTQGRSRWEPANPPGVPPLLYRVDRADGDGVP